MNAIRTKQKGLCKENHGLVIYLKLHQHINKVRAEAELGDAIWLEIQKPFDKNFNDFTIRIAGN